VPPIRYGMVHTILLFKNRFNCFRSFVIRSQHNNVLTNNCVRLYRKDYMHRFTTKTLKSVTILESSFEKLTSRKNRMILIFTYYTTPLFFLQHVPTYMLAYLLYVCMHIRINAKQNYITIVTIFNK